MVLCDLPFFLAVITVILHQSVGMPTGTWIYYASFHVFPKGLLHWFFVVERYRNWVVPGFWDCSLFKGNMGSRARHRWEYTIIFECNLGEMLQELILKYTNVFLHCGGKRMLLEAIWQFNRFGFGAQFFMLHAYKGDVLHCDICLGWHCFCSVWEVFMQCSHVNAGCLAEIKLIFIFTFWHRC